MPEAKVDPSEVRNVAVKPGWQSTEAWLALGAQVLGAIMYSGLLSPDDPVEAKILKLGGVALAILSALGYQAQRGWVKASAVKGAAMVAIAEAQADAVKGAAVGQLAPLVEKALSDAVDKAVPPSPSP